MWSELKHAYRAAVALCTRRSVHLSSENTVLVVLDAIDEYAALFDAATRRNLSRLVARAADANVPIVFTSWARHDRSAADALDAAGHWSYYTRGPSSLLCELLEFAEGRTYPMRYPDALRSSAADVIRSGQSVVVAGCWTESCVVHTARAVAFSGGRPVIVAPACASYSRVAGWLALLQAKMFYAQTVSDVVFV